MDNNVNLWKQEGKIHIWKNKNEDYWNLTADNLGCNSLIKLLSLMKESEWNSKRSIDLFETTFTADHGGENKITCAQKLKVSYFKDPHLWNISCENQSIFLELDTDSHVMFENALKDLNTGGGDYSIGEPPLWIWWYVEKQQ